MEPFKEMKCTLCLSGEKDEIRYGDFLVLDNVGVHTICLYLSSNLTQDGEEFQGILGFLKNDIKAEAKRASKLNCCYCRHRGANIGCCEVKCKKAFHTICGMKNLSENQFVHTFNSYCNKHVRKVKYRPAKNEKCSICFDDLQQQGERFNSVNMLRAPCCKNGWFHKYCLQRFAMTSGYFFKCPLCNNNERFRRLAYRGIYIPDRDAAWETEPQAYQELLQRVDECSAVHCRSRGGRKDTNNSFIYCSVCGATAVHERCWNSDGQFTCNECLQIVGEDSGRDSLQKSQLNDNLDESEDVDVCNDSTDSKTSETLALDVSHDNNIEARNNETEENSDIEFIDVDTDNSNIGTHCRTRTKNVNTNILHCIEDEDEIDDDDDNNNCSNNSNRNNRNLKNDGESETDIESDDDPLENFEKHMNRQKLNEHKMTKIKSSNDGTTTEHVTSQNPHNVSCIAQRTRRSIGNRQINARKTNESEIARPSTPTEVCQSSTTHRRCKRIQQNVLSPMDISCIAYRTRCHSAMILSNGAQSTNRSDECNRCEQTNCTNAKDICSISSSSSSTSSSSTSSSSTSSSSSSMSVLPHLNISCVANRTRNRRSISTNARHILDDIAETDESTTTSSQDPSSLTKENLVKHNLNNRKTHNCRAKRARVISITDDDDDIVEITDNKNNDKSDNRCSNATAPERRSQHRIRAQNAIANIQEKRRRSFSSESDNEYNFHNKRIVTYHDDELERRSKRRTNRLHNSEKL